MVPEFTARYIRQGQRPAPLLHQKLALHAARRPLTRVRVAEFLGPAASSSSASANPQAEQQIPLGPSEVPERFVDVGALLKDFNPLTGSHLLRWSDSEDEDGAEQAEVPVAGDWEDASSGYQGLEYQPSWIDYRASSDSDDPDAARVPGASLAAMLPDLGLPGQEPSSARGAAMHPGALAADAAGPPSAYSPEGGFQEMGAAELEERLATGQVALLLDVRSRAEFESGHIAGSVNLPLDPDLSAAVRSGALDEFRTRPVAVVCGSGGRSAQASVRLSRVFGWTHVTNVAGGVKGWVREGLPVQVSPQRPAGGGGGCGGGGGGGCGCKGKPAA